MEKLQAMSIDPRVTEHLQTVQSRINEPPAVLALPLKTLAAALLGNSPRAPEEPEVAWSVAFQHEALKLESQAWALVNSRLNVTYSSVLSATRLVLCWRLLGSPAEKAAQEILHLACQYCSESREHHLLRFWPELKSGLCSESLLEHLSHEGARGSFDSGPYAEDVFPFQTFSPEQRLLAGEKPALDTPPMPAEFEELLVALALRDS